MDLTKPGWKKQGHCYSKREEAAWPFLFLNNNDPVFMHPAFFRSIFWTWFFSGSQTDPCFQNKNSGCRLTGWIPPDLFKSRVCSNAGSNTPCWSLASWRKGWAIAHTGFGRSLKTLSQHCYLPAHVQVNTTLSKLGLSNVCMMAGHVSKL